ncbi:MAG: ATP-grasp fold amidoligase family protein [Candidatus Limnocylindria bacterium]
MRSRLRALLWRHLPRAMLLLRYVRHFRRLPRLRRPRTFTDNVLVKLLFDRDPKLILFADKFAVRGYVAKKLGGEQNLTTLYAVVDRPEEIGGLSLPDRFIMKPNHLSGRVKVVKDLAAIERTDLEALAAGWFRQNLGFERGEWAYRDIRPQVLFEELLEFEGQPPSDYRFYCFNGEPRLLGVTRDHLGPDPTRTFYDVEFKVLPVRLVGSTSRHVAVDGEPPPNYREMLEITRKLSAGTDFLRVDLYNLGGRIVFGELTNYPAGGLRSFDPPSFDQTLGSYWTRQKSP